jgi:alpha-L-fucosidase 2
MPDGGVQKETVVLNDISLWSGGVQDADDPNAGKYLDSIRSLLNEGKNDEAQDKERAPTSRMVPTRS